jgi:glycosyltransferase involved in cell wall biosynthesis
MAYARRFRRLVEAHGPYDILHCHEHHWCGVLLRLGAAAGIPHRIAHSRVESPPPRGALRPMYEKTMRRWIDCHMTCGLAVSDRAAASLFGPAWQQDPRIRVFRSGIELAPFRETLQGIRHELGLSKDAPVVGHVGLFNAQKNHAVLLRAFAALLEQRPDARLLLVGEGPLRGEVETLVRRLGVEPQVHFLGPRNDVPRLMRGAMDALVLPSRFEGLPRAALEAQAAGLPLLLSDAITREAAVVPELVRFRSLSEPARVWAADLAEILSEPPPLPPPEALARLEASPFSIERNAAELEVLYEQLARP